MMQANYLKTFLNPATGRIAGWKCAEGKLHDHAFLYVAGAAVAGGLVDSERRRCANSALIAGWRGPWDESRQARWIDRFFRTVGRMPAVTALNYWDFDDAQAFIPFSGLVRRDGVPKAGYTALQQIARDWREFMGDHHGHR